MKANISQIVNAYNALENIKTTSLEVSDITAVLSARRVLRSHVEDFRAFEHDAREKLKPENYDTLVDIEGRIKDATEEEKRTYQEGASAYLKAVADAINAEFSAEVEIDFSFPIETAAKIAKNEGWTIDQAEVLSMLM